MTLAVSPARQVKLLADVLCHCIELSRAGSQLPEPRRHAAVEPLIKQHLQDGNRLDLNEIWRALLHEPGVTERALASAFAAMEDMELFLQLSLVPIQRLQKLTPPQRQALLGECQVNRTDVERMLRHARIESNLEQVKGFRPTGAQPVIANPGETQSTGSKSPESTSASSSQPSPTPVPRSATATAAPIKTVAPGEGGPPPGPPSSPGPPTSGAKSPTVPMALLAGRNTAELPATPRFAAGPKSSGPQPALGAPEGGTTTAVPAPVRPTDSQVLRSLSLSNLPAVRFTQPTPILPSTPLASGSVAAVAVPAVPVPDPQGGTGGEGEVRDARLRTARELLQKANAQMMAEAVRSRPSIPPMDPKRSAGSASVSARKPPPQQKPSRRVPLLIGGIVLALLAVVGYYFLGPSRTIDPNSITGLRLKEGQQNDDAYMAIIDDPRWPAMSQDAKKAAVTDVFQQLHRYNIRSLVLNSGDGTLQAQVSGDGQAAPLVLVPTAKNQLPPQNVPKR